MPPATIRVVARAQVVREQIGSPVGVWAEPRIPGFAWEWLPRQGHPFLCLKPWPSLPLPLTGAASAGGQSRSLGLPWTINTTLISQLSNAFIRASFMGIPPAEVLHGFTFASIMRTKTWRSASAICDTLTLTLLKPSGGSLLTCANNFVRYRSYFVQVTACANT